MPIPENDSFVSFTQISPKFVITYPVNNKPSTKYIWTNDYRVNWRIYIYIYMSLTLNEYNRLQAQLRIILHVLIHSSFVDAIGRIDLLHISHNASQVSCPTIHHFVTEMCTSVHISVTKRCIVGYLSDALWDLWNGPNWPIFEIEPSVGITAVSLFEVSFFLVMVGFFYLAASWTNAHLLQIRNSETNSIVVSNINMKPRHCAVHSWLGRKTSAASWSWLKWHVMVTLATRCHVTWWHLHVRNLIWEDTGCRLCSFQIDLSLAKIDGTLLKILRPAWTKWTPFRRRHFQVHFVRWKFLNSD